jgi:hypothetical protein
MAGADYKIKKIEKGPLQRFKNQNLLIKKFGEVGLQIYKAITGKRTTIQLKQDLGIDPSLFDQVLNYMQDAGMAELEPVSIKPKGEEPPEAPEEPEEAEPEVLKEKELPGLEELPEAEEEELPPLEEKPHVEPEEEITFEEIKPEFEGVGFEEEEPEEEPEEPSEEEPEFVEDIEPISEEEPPEEPEEEPPEEPEEGPMEPEVPPEEEEITFAGPEEEEFAEEKPQLSPVEKIISDKYGDLGIQVYSLIDGQRTAEEIMSDTGLTEAKLVEILDFMDEQGIIKLDYPKGGRDRELPPPRGPMPPIGGRAARAPPPSTAAAEQGMGFVPMIEREESLEGARGVPSPLVVPVKAPMDFVKSVQMKAKIMLKLGSKGSKVMEQVDGKHDMIDIALRLDIPLYEVNDMLRFMMENGVLILKGISRSDVHKKYGDDGYSVYKRYGKEGLMLYELIGKELTIKQMADKITKERSQIVDMFIFIHQVLGIELPIDKQVLARQLDL